MAWLGQVTRTRGLVGQQSLVSGDSWAVREGPLVASIIQQRVLGASLPVPSTCQ